MELIDSVLDTFGAVWSWVCWGLFLIALVVLVIGAARHPGRRLSILWGFCRAVGEPILVWSIFILHMWYIFRTDQRLLGLVFPWPVAAGVTLAFVCVIVRSRRRRRLSSARMWRYVFYAIAFWGFYSAPLDSGPTALLGFGVTFLSIAGIIYLADEETYGSSVPEAEKTRPKTPSGRPRPSG